MLDPTELCWYAVALNKLNEREKNRMRKTIAHLKSGFLVIARASKKSKQQSRAKPEKLNLVTYVK